MHSPHICLPLGIYTPHALNHVLSAWRLIFVVCLLLLLLLRLLRTNNVTLQMLEELAAGLEHR